MPGPNDEPRIGCAAGGGSPTEQAALLVVAWLLRAGDRLAAVTLVDTLARFADRLQLAATPSDAPLPDRSVVCRETVGQVRGAVEKHAPNERIEAMREALTVWN